MLPRESDALSPSLSRSTGRQSESSRLAPGKKRNTLQWPWSNSPTRRSPSSARRSNLPSAEKIQQPNKGYQRYLFLALLFIFSQIVFLQSRVFKIQTIEITGNAHIKTKTVLTQLGVHNGDSMWNASPRQLAKQLVAQREIYQATVSYSLPGRISVAIQERVPVLQVCSIDNPQNWFLMDREGLVLRPIQSPNPALPRLMLPHPVTTQTRLHPKTLANLAKAIRTLDPSLAYTVWYYSLDEQGGLRVKTFANRSVVQVMLGDVQGAASKGPVLQAIRERLAQEFPQMHPVQIDLRTNSPSVRFDKPLPSTAAPNASPTPAASPAAAATPKTSH